MQDEKGEINHGTAFIMDKVNKMKLMLETILAA